MPSKTLPNEKKSFFQHEYFSKNHLIGKSLIIKLTKAILIIQGEM